MKKEKEQNQIFSKEEVIVKYTEQDAVRDQILYDITELNSDWKKGIFNYVTTNLLNKGYIKERRGLPSHDKEFINIPNLVDLLNQANQIVREKSENFTKHDWLFSGDVELPSGKRQQIFIQQNSTGKYTLMLPEDY